MGCLDKAVLPSLSVGDIIAASVDPSPGPPTTHATCPGAASTCCRTSSKVLFRVASPVAESLEIGGVAHGAKQQPQPELGRKLVQEPNLRMMLAWIICRS